MSQRFDYVPMDDPPHDFLIVLPGEEEPVDVCAFYWRSAMAYGWLVSILSTVYDREAMLKPLRTHIKEALAEHNGYGFRVLAGVGRGAGLALDFALNGDAGAQAFILVDPHPADMDLERVKNSAERAAERGLEGVIMAPDEPEALMTVLDDADLSCTFLATSKAPYPSDFAVHLKAVLSDLK